MLKKSQMAVAGRFLGDTKCSSHRSRSFVEALNAFAVFLRPVRWDFFSTVRSACATGLIGRKVKVEAEIFFYALPKTVGVQRIEIHPLFV